MPSDRSAPLFVPPGGGRKSDLNRGVRHGGPTGQRRAPRVCSVYVVPGRLARAHRYFARSGRQRDRLCPRTAGQRQRRRCCAACRVSLCRSRARCGSTAAPVHTLRPVARERLRLDRFSWIDPEPRLVPELTVWRKRPCPLLLKGFSHKAAKQAAVGWLERLDVGMFARKRPDALLQAQRQQVAVARALVSTPSVLFADEPDRPLHRAEGTQLLRTLTTAARTHRITVVIATQNPDVAAPADRTIPLQDGRVTPLGHSGGADKEGHAECSLSRLESAAPSPWYCWRRLMVAAASAGAGFLLLAALGYAAGHPARSSGAQLHLLWSLVPLAAAVYLAVAVARTRPERPAAHGHDGGRPGTGRHRHALGRLHRALLHPGQCGGPAVLPVPAGRHHRTAFRRRGRRAAGLRRRASPGRRAHPAVRDPGPRHGVQRLDPAPAHGGRRRPAQAAPPAPPAGCPGASPWSRRDWRSRRTPVGTPGVPPPLPGRFDGSRACGRTDRLDPDRVGAGAGRARPDPSVRPHSAVGPPGRCAAAGGAGAAVGGPQDRPSARRLSARCSQALSLRRR